MAEITFPLPDLGEGLEDAVILEWHVKIGDRVERNDILVEVEPMDAPALAGQAPVISLFARSVAQPGEPVQRRRNRATIGEAGGPSSVGCDSGRMWLPTSVASSVIRDSGLLASTR